MYSDPTGKVAGEIILGLVLGLIVAWLVDGLLIAITGKSGAEWVAIGISKLTNWVRRNWPKWVSRIKRYLPRIVRWGVNYFRYRFRFTYKRRR